MRPHIEHLKYVLRHKWFVFWACLELGIPWLGIIHDLSKFSRAEWRPYTLNFYSGWKKDERPQWVVLLFNKALQHHYDRNAHHPEHWHIGSMVLPMPDRYRREMVADWVGAGKAKRGSGFHHGETDGVRAWYRRNKDRLRLHPDTGQWVEEMLDDIG